jgi:outer membrane protein OmpA-like peptidoglycan-associated protein
LILEGVNFAFDSAKISPESGDILDKAVQALRDAPNVSVRIEGYTDSIGTEKYNLKLSQKRAQAVVDYLVDHGIDPTRLDPVGYGESDPVASNATPEGRYKNRRVELEVIPSR